MKKLGLEISASIAMGAVIIGLGILAAFIGVRSHDIEVIIRGCTFIALGAAYSALGIERLLNFKLDEIHEGLGPYEAKKRTLFEIRGKILKFVGICAYTGGTILLLFSGLGYLQIGNSDLSIGLLAIGLAFSSLGRRHADNRKFDDIADGIHSMQKDILTIADKLVVLYKEKGKSRENSGDDNISDVEG